LCTAICDRSGGQLDVGPRLAAMERHPQCVEDEVGAHVAGELPAGDRS
jgi:hypothetical protein